MKAETCFTAPIPTFTSFLALHCHFVTCCYEQVLDAIHISITSAEKDSVLEANCVLPENQTEHLGVQPLGPTFAVNSCLSLV